jgi:hypothetical protein
VTRLDGLLETARAAARAAADLLAGARPREIRGKTSPLDLVFREGEQVMSLVLPRRTQPAARAA